MNFPLIGAGCALLSLAFALLAPARPGAAELVYFRSDGCSYCEQWDREIGGIYPKTDEARELALRPVDVDGPAPEELQYIKGVVFTPTFVAVENGREIGRIVGYGGDIFFWEQMSALMNTLKLARARQVPGCPDSDIAATPGGAPRAC